jgi:hypothetical protein
MMKKYRILKIIAGVLFMTAWLPSCKDFLSVDKYFSDELKMDSIFAQKRYIEAYMWGAVALFPDEGQIYENSYTPGPLATDEAFTLWSGYAGMQFALGEINPTNLGSLNTWGSLYKIIRKCNTIVARIDEATDWTASERLRILSLTRFYRAYAYYNLLMNYGPPVLLGDELLETNEDIEYYDRPRSTYDEAVEYICSEFEEAAQFMSLTVSIMDFGRPTKGAAYGFIARLRLIHASPLFNGGQSARTYFGNWTRKTDGVHYVSQTPDEKRWAIAAAAAKRIMDMESAGMPLYRLYTVDRDDDTPELPGGVTDQEYYNNDFPDGAKNIDPFKSYSEIFTGEAVAAINKEYIWGRKSGAVGNIQKFFPVSSHSGAPTGDGWNGLCIPQKIIDAYKMVDGGTIDNYSDKYPYSETGFSSGNELKNFSGYRFSSGDVSNMYVNREARFYASIGFSECLWPCESSARNNFTITYYYGSSDGKGGVPNPLNYPITGYVLKKTIHRLDALSGTNARVMDKTFPIIRYAEILLSYAEALNNLTGSHTVEIDGQSYTVTHDVNEIKKAFNQVRYRAGLPGLSETELADPKKVQQNIETERMVEFLHENRRYFDVRRWGIYEEVESAQITGMNTDAGKSGFYQRVVPNTSRIGSRVVDRKLVFVPIPNTEIKRIPSFDQNPGW